ncbi:NADH oxidase [Streptomyces yaanensis]|uniref:NADH oxidase n=1 Tax=Streptomyces yaanensis TaxID=1142239 RepID=A0ABV7SE04_9ACTN|nr:NADH oxidase [Streptomyces sp. CGMCC 4.7035]WNB99353.1 NADH oxidase [Streptomyces sp. CGMCC 4.7035]
MPRVVGSRALHLWSLREDVVVEVDADGRELVLRSGSGTERISRPDPLVREALRRMELGPVLLANVVARIDGGDEDGREERALLVLLPVLSRLSHLMVRTLSWEDLRGPLLSVVSTRPGAVFTPVRLPAQRLIRLIGGVSLTLEKAGFALNSAVSPHRVHLHRPEAVWVVGLLAWPVTPSHACAVLPLPPEVTWAMLNYLAAAGMTEDCEPAIAEP